MAPITNLDLLSETRSDLTRRQMASFPSSVVTGVIAGCVVFFVIFFVLIGVWIWVYCKPSKKRGFDAERFDDSSTLSGDTLHARNSARWSNDSLLEKKPLDAAMLREQALSNSRTASDESVPVVVNELARPEPSVEKSTTKLKRHSLREAVAVKLAPATGKIRKIQER